MVAVFLHSGFGVTTASSQGVISVRIAIGTDDTGAAADDQGPSALPVRVAPEQSEVTLTE